MKLGGSLKLLAWNQKDSYRSLEEVLRIPVEEWKSILSNEGIENFVIVSTCNRFEIYYHSDRVLEGVKNEEYSNKLQDSDVISHLFKVTAGLDSMSVGENEILHQIKESFDEALDEGHVKDPLAFVFRKSISSGKLVRRDTAISRGKVSIPALAVDLLERQYGVSGKRVSVIGTGKMASDIIKYLSKAKPYELSVIGRNYERYSSLPKNAITRWVPFSDLAKEIENSDIIVAATTSKEVIVTRDQIADSGQKKVILDVSNPRNVEEPENGEYHLIDLKTLSTVLEKNRERKNLEVKDAEKIVSKQSESAISILARLEVEKLIGEIYKNADEVRKKEISRFKRALASGVDIDKAVDSMSSSLIKRILASQTEIIRNVHGSEITDDLRNAVSNAFSSNVNDTSSEESQDRQDIRSRQARTPR